MKVLMAPIEMIAKFDIHGKSSSAFLYKDKVINFDQIINLSEKKLVGDPMRVYSCQAEINGELIRYEIKYDL